MSTQPNPGTTTPPEGEPTTTPGAPPSRSTPMAAIATALGVIIIVAMIAQGTLLSIGGAGTSAEHTYQADVSGVTSLDLNVASAQVQTLFTDVDVAVLTVDGAGWGSANEWTFEVVGSQLRVHEQDTWVPTWGVRDMRVTLQLPERLDGELDVDLSLAAGTMTFVGDVDAATVNVSAGAFTFDGEATTLDADLSAGFADIAVANTTTATATVSAGQFRLQVDGDQPDEVDVSVSAGEVLLWLPPGDYAATGTADAGDRTIAVSTDPTSPHALNVNVDAGSATVNYGG